VLGRSVHTACPRKQQSFCRIGCRLFATSPASHHRNDSDLIAKKARIDTCQAPLLTYFLQTLKAALDGGGTLLDHSLVMCGGGMGGGNLHRHSDLPCLIAGASAAPSRRAARFAIRSARR
jgi:hypothetical protein